MQLAASAPYEPFGHSQKETEYPYPTNHFATKADDSTRTTDPIVTGTSVLAIKYSKGILMAADTLASYGSLARFKNIERMRVVGKKTLIGASGEYSDFQYLLDVLGEIIDRDNFQEDKHQFQPREIFSYLTRVMYNRRNQMNPLWNQLVVAGVTPSNRSPKGLDIFLGQVDLQGTFYEDNTLATGYGAYLARPLLRKAYRPDLTLEEARDALEKGMRVLYYRDARTINKIQLANVTVDEIIISPPYALKTEWSHTEAALGYPKPVSG